MKRPRIVAIDTWAFVEVLLHRARRREVETLLGEIDGVVTTRDVLVETSNWIVKASGDASQALGWLDEVAGGPVRVLEPSLDEIRAFGRERPVRRLSLTDLSLAWAAESLGIREIATEDGGFRELDLVPLFSKR